MISQAERGSRIEGSGTAGGNMSDSGQIRVDQEELAELCRRHRVRRLSFFGSVLRDDFGPDSDIDVLVEFEQGVTVGLRLITMQEELSRMLGGRGVDLITPKFLNRRIRDRVLADARIQYEEG